MLLADAATPLLPHVDPDEGVRSLALSALLHAAAFGIFFLIPPGADVLALDDMFAEAPSRVAMFPLAEPSPSHVSAAAGQGVGNGASGERAEDDDAGATPAPRHARARRADVDPLAALTAIAGTLRARSAASTAFVAADALAALEVDAAYGVLDGARGLDMNGVGRGTGNGGGTIAAVDLGMVWGAGGIGATCGSVEFERRVASMGRLVAIESCSASGSFGASIQGGMRALARPEVPDELDASPNRTIWGCGCGDWEANGSLSRDVVRRVVGQHRSEVRFCYEQALGSRPDLEGRVTEQWVIAPSGRVQSVSIDGGDSDLSNAGVQACITQAVARWTFPASAGPTVVHYPFVLGVANR